MRSRAKAPAAPPIRYHYEPIGPGATQGARPETHYTSFRRTPLATADDAPAQRDQDDDDENEEGDGDDDADGARRRNETAAASSSSSSSKALEGLPAEETFEIGDVVYLPSSYQAPLVGVLTHLWTLDDRVQTEQETIYGVVRLLHWPEWMSTMAKRRMAGLTSKNEVYYTHKAPKVSKRRTQTAIKTGQQVDDFEAGPALHDYSFDVQEIIAKVSIHPSQDECDEAVQQATATATAAATDTDTDADADADAAAGESAPGDARHSRRSKSQVATASSAASRQPKTHCIYKGRSFPTHLFCERAVDPNRELFWKVDWSKVVQRGKQDRRWDLVDQSSDELRALTDQGQRVNDVVEEMTASRELQSSSRGSAAGTPAKAAAGAAGAPYTPRRRSRLAQETSASALSTPTTGRTRRAAAAASTPSKTFSIASEGSVTPSEAEDGDDDDEDDGRRARHRDDDDDEDASGSDDDFKSLSEGGDDDEDDAEVGSGEDDDDDDDDLLRTPSRKRARSSKGPDDLMTPSKRRVLATPRKTLLALNSPAKATATPRSRARLLGIKARNLPHPSLPARPAKMSSLSGEELRQLRLGMTRIVFMPYTDRQLVEIVKSRLGIASTTTGMGPGGAGAKALAARQRDMETDATRGCKDVFHLDAITYVSKRVSNVSGDARRMLDVCRRAVELVEMRAVASVAAVAAAATGSTSTSNGGNNDAAATATVKAVTIADMKSVLDSMVKSGRVSHILSLPLHGKVLLLSLFSCLRRSGLVEAELVDVLTHHRAVCRMYAIHPSPLLLFSPSSSSSSSSSSLPLGAGAGAGGGVEKVVWDKIDFAPALAQLCSLGLILAVGQGAGPGRARGFSRLILACQEDEVRLAFGNDADERLRKML
ncbi:uncharacterized protein PFL1_02128 [Pseudozyma flocculosa PF-1]|uniref:uncharacterized protein n=1 Tax=Pseudozyma flocculosa PF-1 TaxID=1277687 RepID=UPI0004561900|nr:uncharacterized protein PFL1_02128 [Pseudozyma flocculosa PF-1]EPQ30604.1 hypothetical protein PFL1_02128 [Pseudozyma flocculosa PF-1]